MKRPFLAVIALVVLGGCATINNGATPTTTQPQATIVVPHTPPRYVPPSSTSPPSPQSGFTITTTGDVWLKSGPGSAFSNIVVANRGDQVLVTCFDPSGQPDTTASGVTTRGWYRTIYDGNYGWISENYLNAGAVRGIAYCVP